MSYTNGLDNPELYFQTKLYTGNGSTNAITLDGDENMQPDWVWVKDRGRAGYNHNSYDSVRGATKLIWQNLTNAENTYADSLTSFNSDGFTLGADSNGEANVNTQSYVAWNWKESATAGFDIVTFTGSGGTQNISHSLSAKPEWIITKSRSASGAWYTYHGANTAAPETDFLKLNDTDATADNATVWNDTAPTTSVFTVGSAFDNTTTYIAYCFAEKKGYSKFGSYTGNGNAEGPFIYTGFKPAFVIQKRTDSSSNWTMVDNKRDVDNIVNTQVIANGNGAEFSENVFDFLSNGFKVRAVHGGYLNASGGSYIYMAFAESPFVNSNGVPTNAR